MCFVGGRLNPYITAHVSLSAVFDADGLQRNMATGHISKVVTLAVARKQSLDLAVAALSPPFRKISQGAMPLQGSVDELQA